MFVVTISFWKADLFGEKAGEEKEIFEKNEKSRKMETWKK